MNSVQTEFNSHQSSSVFLRIGQLSPLPVTFMCVVMCILWPDLYVCCHVYTVT